MKQIKIAIKTIKQSALFWVLCFFILSNSLQAQNFIDLALPTNYIANNPNNLRPIFNIVYNEKNDTSLELQFYLGDTNNLVKEKKVFLINKKDLSLIDTIVMWERNGRFVDKSNFGEFGTLSLPIKNQTTNVDYIFETDLNAGDSISLSFFTARDTYLKDSLFLSFFLENKVMIMTPFIFDSTILMGFTNLSGDSGFYRRYNFNGNLLHERIIDLNNFNLAKDFDFPWYGNSKQHPINDSLFTLEMRGISEVSVISLNKYTFEKVSDVGISIPISIQLFNSVGFFRANAKDYFIDSTGVTFGGNFIQINKLTNQRYSRLFYSKVAWDSTLISFNIFGDTLSSNDQYGTSYYLKNNKHYLGGVLPRSVNPFVPQLRRLLIYQINGNQVDSIFLYGNSNHGNANILVDKFDDIYVFSGFSNAWTNDSIFIQVTKLSSSLLTSIKEQTISRKIHLYPNPTKDYLNSYEFEQGDQVRIYSIKGQLMKELTLNSNNRIDVSDFAVGTYLLQLLKKGEAKSIVFIKQ